MGTSLVKLKTSYSLFWIRYSWSGLSNDNCTAAILEVDKRGASVSQIKNQPNYAPLVITEWGLDLIKYETTGLYSKYVDCIVSYLSSRRLGWAM